MRRAAAVLAAAVFLSGCVTFSDSGIVGPGEILFGFEPRLDDLTHGWNVPATRGKWIPAGAVSASEHALFCAQHPGAPYCPRETTDSQCAAFFPGELRDEALAEYCGRVL